MLVNGALLVAILVYFRFEKVSILHMDLGLLDTLSLLLPELGSVLAGESVFLALAGFRSRWWGAFWWALLAASHGAALIGSVVEQTFYLHTGSRLNLDLIGYALENLEMLGGLVLSGADTNFMAHLLMAAAILLAGLLISPWVRVALPLWKILSLTVVGSLVALLLPATALIRQADLAPSTFGELFRLPKDPEAAAARAAAYVQEPSSFYQAPRLVKAGEKQPNIVLIILESTRFDILPPYAPPKWQHLAPAFGRIAKEGWVFNNVYSSVSHTSKALVGILCGIYPRLEIPIRETLQDNLPLSCLPHLLERAGYRSAFLQTAMSNFENRPGLVRNLGFQTAAFMETVARPGYEPIGYLGIDDFALVAPARSWLQNGGPEPFLLTVLSLTPHHPYQIPGEPTPPLAGDLMPHYQEAIRHQDRFLGTLVDELRKMGALENTVLVILGDHGEAFGEHRRMQHDAVPYEETVRVPLLIHAPWLLGEARRVGGLRHQHDLLPTLLEITGIHWEGTLPGRSLLSSDGHERVMTSCWYTDFCIAMREGDRKYVYHFGMRPTQVFDLVRDPGEQQSISETLSREELRGIEDRLLGTKLSVDAFWDRHPARDGVLTWWQR